MCLHFNKGASQTVLIHNLSDPTSQRTTSLTAKVKMKFSRSAYTRKDKFHRQLQVLRSILPPRKNNLRSTKWRSVLCDAAKYIQDMKRQIRELTSDIEEYTVHPPADSGYLKLDKSPDKKPSHFYKSHVEVLQEEEGLEIHLSCEKKPGLLIEVMEALEGLGLIFAKVNIQCNHRLEFDAFGAKSSEGRTIEAEVVRDLLVQTITKTSDAE